MIPYLLAQLTGDWRPALAAQGVCLEAPLSTVKIGYHAPEGQKINLLVFNASENQPALVIRLATGPGQQAILRHEHRTLEQLAMMRDLHFVIPRPLGLYEMPECLALAESCLPGQTMYTRLCNLRGNRPEQVRSDLQSAVAILSSFQRATACGSIAFDCASFWQERVAAFRAHGPAMDFAYTRWSALQSQAAGLGVVTLPCGASHNDFWPGNILVNGETLGIIDWEGCLQKDLPFHDLFFFLATYATHYPWQGWKKVNMFEGFRCGFLETNWLSSLLRDTATAFFTQLGLGPSHLVFFFHVFLLEMIWPSRGTSQQYPNHQDAWISIYQALLQNEKGFMELYG